MQIRKLKFRNNENEFHELLMAAQWARIPNFWSKPQGVDFLYLIFQNIGFQSR